MADTRVTAEIQRLSQMDDDDFLDMVVGYVMGGTGRRAPRDVQGAALGSPQLAPRTLDALELAMRRAKSFNPIREGETKRDQQARIAPWRARIKAVTGPIQDVVDDLAHEHAKELAALDDDSFTDRWTAFILDEPVPPPTSPRVEALAFRSPRVARRAADICRLMLEEPPRFLPSAAPGESRKAREQRVEDFRRRVEAEAGFLRYAVQYGEARHGRMPAEPNHRLQALRLLGQAHPQELLQLLRQVRGEDRAAKQAARRDRRDVRRAERSGAR
ncbi:hypothetical protein AB0D65_29300 [Streptomyces griseoloalbus]|uniref:Uncharacterized protein n=1 Tax=Streptomyces griseoloalbus TaxID=67303 RepID=A0ABV3ECV7_9ACTN